MKRLVSLELIIHEILEDAWNFYHENLLSRFQTTEIWSHAVIENKIAVHSNYHIYLLNTTPLIVVSLNGHK